ncbi:MAG TPA: HD domain-containing protein [Nevskiaceae bacterium]|nr:HD domain-containing protein [Nevskiaceae bacterium]
MPLPIPIQTTLPALDALFAPWREALGEDYAAYRNHVCRLLHFCEALAPAPLSEEDRRRLMIAGVYHDLGIWSDGTVDYLPPSRTRAEQHLQAEGRGAWIEEVGLMIDEHHRLRRARAPAYPLVEVFRQADLIDVSLGLIRFGLPRETVRAVRRAFPNAGFHRRLMRLAGVWFRAHPLSPPPFLKW